MALERWGSVQHPAVLGVLVHGPVIVARSVGITLAIKTIFAFPDGLEIALVLCASGVQAEGAGRQTFGEHVPELGSGWKGGSEPSVIIEMNGKRATAYPYEGSNGGGEDVFTSMMSIGVDAVPSDGLLTVVGSWPEAGLAEASTTLTLDSLHDLESRTIPL